MVSSTGVLILIVVDNGLVHNTSMALIPMSQS